MKRVHVLGRKNHGKTQLIVDLIRECVQREITVASIKHTHHAHELDTPGKDSQQHREAGAAAVGVVARNMTAVFKPRAADDPADPYDVLLPWMEQHQLLLVEGDTATTAPKIEVWRVPLGTSPIAAEDPNVLAVFTDDICSQIPLEKQLPRRDIGFILDWIWTHIPDA